jgi:predicted nucleic acid-binding protein
VGREHALRAACRRLVGAVRSGTIEATTTPEVIQEFAHIRARRRGRTDAVALSRRYAEMLAPLLVAEPVHLERGLGLFEQHPALGAFDAVLAAVALAHEADAFVSADGDFAVVPGLRYIAPGTPAFDDLIRGGEAPA